MLGRSLLFLLLASLPVSAQTPAPHSPDAGARSAVVDPSRLTLERIFASGDFRPERVPSVHWLEHGAYVSQRPSKNHKGASDVIRVDAEGKTEVLIPAEKLIPPDAKEPLQIHDLAFSKNLSVFLIYTNSVKVWRHYTRGDYYLFDRTRGTLSRVGSDAKPSTLMFAKLSPDASLVGYVRDNNLHVEPVRGGPAVRLTNDGAAEVINGTFDWVYEEEFSCRDGWRWSPDGKKIAYWQLDTRGVKTYTLVDNVAGTYPALKTFAYPKTGERNSACRIGVVGADGGSTTWMAVPGDTRTDYYLPRMEWAANSSELAIQRLNRLQNTIDVMLADASAGSVRTVLTDRDGAWVDLHDDTLEWLDNGAAFTWVSERDGWRHVYRVARDGTNVQRITNDDFDVIRVFHVDEKAGRVYFAASPRNATQQYLYASPLSGGPASRLSPDDQPGWHDYDFSPDGGWAIHTYSRFGTPPQTDIVAFPEYKVARTLATNEKLRGVVDALAKTPVEFVRLDVGNGVQLDGWLMKPTPFDPSKKYPLLFHVYGEPAGQSVTDHWDGRNYLWHLMLTQQGYAVACVDNRGTPCPRGRDWRRAAYRQIGRLASIDQAAAARELLRRPYLDPARVGVWGWSGGGTMTLNLMFRYPELYRTGMAVAPVPDMRLYDTIYQERYMGLPSDNAEDYKQGSPITHAAGLKGDLLIVHGSGDDNVHYQGTEKLVDKLIELNKPFTLMTYPNRSHSINEGKNTTRHLFELLTHYLNEHLPPGAR